MNNIRQRIVRVQRMKAIEQNQLDVLAAGLSSLEARIQGYHDRIAELDVELGSLGDVWTTHSLTMQNQMSVCAMAIQRKSVELQLLITETEAARDEVLAQVLEAKTKIKGWESLVEKLVKQERQEQANVEAGVADDMYLVKHKR